VAQVHTINSDKAIKAIKQAIACHGFCGSEVPWKIKLTWLANLPRPRTFAQGQGLNPQGQGLDLQGQGLKIWTKAKDNNTGYCQLKL